jgi:mannan polymerase II complex MNN10 subunit
MAARSRPRRAAEHRHQLRLRRLLFLLPLALLLAQLPALLLRRANSLGRRCLPGATDPSQLLLPSPVRDPRLSLAIVTLADEGASGSRGRRTFRGVLAATARNKRAYAAAHGYGLVALPASAVDPSRPPSWSKVLALRAHLRHHHWLFWNDAVGLGRRCC